MSGLNRQPLPLVVSWLQLVMTVDECVLILIADAPLNLPDCCFHYYDKVCKSSKVNHLFLSLLPGILYSIDGISQSLDYFKWTNPWQWSFPPTSP